MTHGSLSQDPWTTVQRQLGAMAGSWTIKLRLGIGSWQSTERPNPSHISWTTGAPTVVCPGTVGGTNLPRA
jgi:hypothetical protein